MSLLSKNILTKLSVRQLPLPGTSLACHALRKQENSSVGAVVKVLSKDPLSTLSILKRANEAYYGLQGTVNSLTHAVEILGPQHVLRMLSVDLNPSSFNIPLHLVMHHGFVTAQIAHRIASGSWLWQNKHERHVGGVFTAGLLHNIGRLAVCVTYPAEACRLYGFDNDTFPISGTLREIERLQFGADYVDMGAFIASKFRLPSGLSNVIRFHANPSDLDVKDDTYRLVETINAASEIASSLGYGINPQGSILHDATSQGLHWLEHEQPGCFAQILSESHDNLVQLDVFNANKTPFAFSPDRLPKPWETHTNERVSSFYQTMGQ